MHIRCPSKLSYSHLLNAVATYVALLQVAAVTQCITTAYQAHSTSTLWQPFPASYNKQCISLVLLRWSESAGR